MITLMVPCLPPSTNNAYVNVPGRGRCLSHDAKVWKNGVGLAVLAKRLEPVRGLLAVTLTFSSLSWFYNNGKPRKIDLGNLEKLLVDAVFTQLHVEDSCIFTMTLHKVIGPEQSTIKIEALQSPSE